VSIAKVNAGMPLSASGTTDARKSGIFLGLPFGPNVQRLPPRRTVRHPFPPATDLSRTTRGARGARLDRHALEHPPEEFRARADDRGRLAAGLRARGEKRRARLRAHVSIVQGASRGPTISP